MFQPAIKGRYPVRQPQLSQGNFGVGMGELSMLIHQLQSLKMELTNLVNAKLKEVDAKVKDHMDTGEMIKDLHKKALGHIQTVKAGPKGNDADEERIVKRVGAKIPAPIDEDKLTKKILAQLPKVDEDGIVRRTLKAIPENKASLKVIQEQFVTDPMSVIDKILELAKTGKFKLKTENIDGLEQTIAAFRHQITTKGYLHGGGTTVAAGTNITLVPNANGTTTINATGGGGTWHQGIPSGTQNGVNTTFTLPTIPTSILFLFLNGQLLTPGGVDYTLTGSTITMVNAPFQTDVFTYNYQ